MGGRPAVAPPLSPLVIEFVGLPGAGKSTICRHLCAAGRTDGAPLTSCTAASFGTSATSHLSILPRKLIAFRRILQSFVEDPHASWRYLRFGLASRPVTLWKVEQALSGIAMLHRLKREQSRRRPEVLMLEQGVVQLLGSLVLPSDGSARPEAGPVVRAALRGRLSGLVWIACPQEIAFERMNSRGYSRTRFTTWSKTESERHLATMQQTLESAVAAAEAAGIAVLRIDALQPVETNCASILEWIARLETGAGDERAATL